MLAPGWGTGTRGGSPPGVKLGSLPVKDWADISDAEILGFLNLDYFVFKKSRVVISLKYYSVPERIQFTLIQRRALLPVGNPL